VNVPAYILDEQGRIRWLNDAAQALAGDSVGKFFTSVLGERDLARGAAVFERNLHRRSHGDYTVDLLAPDGSTSRVEISSTPLGPEGHAIGMFGLAVPVPGQPTAAEPVAPPTHDQLTGRQIEVLTALTQGSSTDQIAAQLGLSRETVRNHIRHILKRLGASSRLEAVAIARRDSLV